MERQENNTQKTYKNHQSLMNMAQMLRLFDMLFSIIMINIFKVDTVQDKMSYLSRKVEAKEERINGNSRKKQKIVTG